MTEIQQATVDTARRGSLAELEAVIERGLNTFVEVGDALRFIREERLFKDEYATFEDYCRARWGFNDRRASQLINAASTVSTIVESGLPAPTNEGQARELSRVPEEDRADVWRKTVERTDGKPTAAAVRETYTPVRPAAPAPRSAPEPDMKRLTITDERAADERDAPQPIMLPIRDMRPPSAIPEIPEGASEDGSLFEEPEDRAADDARLDASLAADMEDSAVVFRANFRPMVTASYAMARNADIGRITQVYAAPTGDRDALIRDLRFIRDFCDRASEALSKTVQIRSAGGTQ